MPFNDPYPAEYKRAAISELKNLLSKLLIYLFVAGIGALLGVALLSR